tara:strand:- start:2611 stop:3288 length:678 start_codon:yes stop_codon:yes gene_type:complete
MKLVALLPMKLHSQRVPGKNFREFNGLPLFRYILNTLLEIQRIDKIIINTDARHELNKYGLEEYQRVVIRDRPAELCGHEISMNKVIKNDVDNVESCVYMMTHTTNPLLSKDTIEKALSRFEEGVKTQRYDSLFTVDRVQTRFYRENGDPVNHDPDNLIQTQDLEPWYEENSNLFIFTRDSFRKTSARIGKKPILFESPKYESIDIDDESDWKIATYLHEYLKSN